jgi:hypothetical protein
MKLYYDFLAPNAIGIEDADAFIYGVAPNSDDVSDFLGCSQEEAQAIIDGDDVDGYPSTEELEADSDFYEYMKRIYEDAARETWEKG